MREERERKNVKYRFVSFTPTFKKVFLVSVGALYPQTVFSVLST
jgi:hypothetical protein